MDSKTAWNLKKVKEDELRAWREKRQALVASGQPDPDAHQPLRESWVWCKTVKLLDGSQIGGAICPLSDANFAIGATGIRTGHATFELASASDMEAFWKQEERTKVEMRAQQDRLEKRDRVLVAAVPPATRAGKDA